MSHLPIAAQRRCKRHRQLLPTVRFCGSLGVYAMLWHGTAARLICQQKTLPEQTSSHREVCQASAVEPGPNTRIVSYAEQKTLLNRSELMAPAVETHFTHDLLFIKARGAQLDEVVASIAAAALFKVKGVAGAEPVFGDYCGPVDEVIEELLDGSGVQYVLTLSTTPGTTVKEMLLIPHPVLKQLVIGANAGPLSGPDPITTERANEQARRAASEIVIQEQNSSSTAGGSPPDDPLLKSTASAQQTQAVAPKAEGEGAIKPAGVYMQELYKMRQQLQSPSPPPQ